MAHGRFYTYRLPTVTIFSRLDIGNYLRKSRPDIPLVEIPVPKEGESPQDVELRQQRLKEAEIIFGDPTLLANEWGNLVNCRWLQSTYAGTIIYWYKAHLRLSITIYFVSQVLQIVLVTRFAGYFGPLMAEYVIGHLVAHQRQFFALEKDQEQSQWNHQTRSSYKPLSSFTLGILGVGDIGLEIAKVCKSAFGMRVLGLVSSTQGRKEAYVDELFDQSRLPELLHEADYLVNVLPSTPETKDLLSGEVLSYCRRKKPLFINVGRGDIIDEPSLKHALDEGYISKAVLDVFPIEPLPSTSVLWKHPDVFISPHVSSVTLDFQVTQLFGENFDKFVQEQPLKYVINWGKGY